MAQAHYAKTRVQPEHPKLGRECAPANASRLRRLLYFFARRSYGVRLQKNFRIQHIGHEFLSELKAPYVIIANHVCNADPFIYNILCPYPIAWIIGKSIERESRFPYLLKVLRTISRSKEMSDLDTIKKIREWIDEGEVVGIFPEGQTSFTGLSHPVPEATAKLLRFLKVPVLSLCNEGGYFAQPRWAWKPRISSRGAGAGAGAGAGPGIVLRYELLFDAEQIQSAKLSEIQEKVAAAIHYDPYHSSAAPYLDRGLKQQNLAESLELILHSCLDCLSSVSISGASTQPSSSKCLHYLGTMYSCKMELRCRACGAVWQISEDAHFLKNKGLSLSLEQYRQKQLSLMRGLGFGLCPEMDFARMRIYKDAELQDTWKRGSLVLSSTALRLSGLSGQDDAHLSFALTEVFAAHVFKYNILEFHTHYQGYSALFVLEFPNKTDSAFLILDSLKLLQELLLKAQLEIQLEIQLEVQLEVPPDGGEAL